MKYIFFIAFALIGIDQIINAHENHDHEMNNWPYSNNKILKTDDIPSSEKSEDKKLIKKDDR